MDDLKLSGVKIGVATSVRKHLWEKAEIYPAVQNDLLPLSQAQRDMLALFRSKEGG